MSLKQVIEIEEIFIQILSFLPKAQHFNYQYVNKYFYNKIQIMFQQSYYTNFLNYSLKHFYNTIYNKFIIYNDSEINNEEINNSLNNNDSNNKENNNAFIKRWQIALQNNIMNNKEDNYLLNVNNENNNLNILNIKTDINYYLQFYYNLNYLYNYKKLDLNYLNALGDIEKNYFLEMMVANRSVVMTDDMFLFKLIERFLTILFSTKENNFTLNDWLKKFYNVPYLNNLDLNEKKYVLQNELNFLLFILEVWIKNYGFDRNGNLNIILEDFLFFILNILENNNYENCKDLILQCKFILQLLFKMCNNFSFEIFLKLDNLLFYENNLKNNLKNKRREIFNNNLFIQLIEKKENLNLLLRTDFNLEEFVFNYIIFTDFLFKNFTTNEIYNKLQSKNNLEDFGILTKNCCIKLYLQFFNNIVNFFTNELLTLKDVEITSQYKFKLYQLKCLFFYLNDYNAVHILNNLLETAFISRLTLLKEKTENLMSKKFKEMIEEIEGIFSSNAGFVKLRKLVKMNAVKNVTTHLGLLLTDITFIKEGNLDTSFTKYKLMMEFIGQLFSVQLKEPIIYQQGTEFIQNSIPSNILNIIYNKGFLDKFKKKKEMKVNINENYLELFVYLATDYVPIDENDLYNLSLQIQPRKTTKK
ncbi:hypothetical protein ABK040_004739 [Willaertia magna]